MDMVFVSTTAILLEKLHAAKMNRPSGEATIVLAPGNTLQLSQPLILAVSLFPSSSAMADHFCPLDIACGVDACIKVAILAN